MADLGLHDLFNVNDMVFVITGGGSGLGEWMALALDRNGASKVFILGRRPEALERTAKKAARHPLSRPHPLFLTIPEDLKAAAATIATQTPFVNAVVANAGLIGPVTSLPPRAADASIASIQAEFWALPEEANQKTMDVNVMGVFHTFVAFLSLLDAGNTHEASRGRRDFIQSQFITVSSMAGLSRGEDVSYLYGAGKAAVVALTKKLSTGFAKMGIRVNSIAPGFYITEMTEFASNGEDWSVPGSLPKDTHAMTRSGSAQDIAGAILFLTSKAGAYVNGNVLLSDGGQFGQGPMMY
ncbi:short chain dehydrogenase reductase [Paraphaeosphaeria sporulosa]